MSNHEEATVVFEQKVSVTVTVPAVADEDPEDTIERAREAEVPRLCHECSGDEHFSRDDSGNWEAIEVLKEGEQ